MHPAISPMTGITMLHHFDLKCTLIDLQLPLWSRRAEEIFENYNWSEPERPPHSESAVHQLYIDCYIHHMLRCSILTVQRPHASLQGQQVLMLCTDSAACSANLRWCSINAQQTSPCGPNLLRVQWFNSDC